MINITDTTRNIIAGGLVVISAGSVLYGIKRKNKSNVGIGILGLLVGTGFFFKDEIKSGFGTFCQTAQQGDESPHLGELSTGGISIFQKWVNLTHNSSVNEDGTPDQKTKDAYTQYGREFLTELVNYYGG